MQVNGSDGSVKYLTVTLAVNNGTQTLSVSPTPITLAGTPGGFTSLETETVTSTVTSNFVGHHNRRRSLGSVHCHHGGPGRAGYRCRFRQPGQGFPH